MKKWCVVLNTVVFVIFRKGLWEDRNLKVISFSNIDLSRNILSWNRYTVVLNIMFSICPFCGEYFHFPGKSWQENIKISFILLTQALSWVMTWFLLLNLQDQFNMIFRFCLQELLVNQGAFTPWRLYKSISLFWPTKMVKSGCKLESSMMQQSEQETALYCTVNCWRVLHSLMGFLNIRKTYISTNMCWSLEGQKHFGSQEWP